MTASPSPILYWLPGPGLALAGAACVRLIAPLLDGRMQAMVLVAGYLIVPVGLAWFASRLGHRAAKRAAEAPDTKA